MLEANGEPTLVWYNEGMRPWHYEIKTRTYIETNDVGCESYGALRALLNRLHVGGLVDDFMWVRDRGQRRVTLMLQYASPEQLDACCRQILLCSRDIVCDIDLCKGPRGKHFIGQVLSESARSPFEDEFIDGTVALMQMLEQQECAEQLALDYNLVGVFPWVCSDRLGLLVVRRYHGYDVVDTRVSAALSNIMAGYAVLEVEGIPTQMSRPKHRQLRHNVLMGGLSIGETAGEHDDAVKQKRGTLSYCHTGDVGVTAGHCLQPDSGALVLQPAVEDLNALVYCTGGRYDQSSPYDHVVGATVATMEYTNIDIPADELGVKRVSVGVDVGVFAINKKRPVEFHALCAETTGAKAEVPSCEVYHLGPIATWPLLRSALRDVNASYALNGASSDQPFPTFRCCSAGALRVEFRDLRMELQGAAQGAGSTGLCTVTDLTKPNKAVILHNQLLLDGGRDKCKKGDSGGVFFLEPNSPRAPAVALGMLHIGLIESKKSIKTPYAVATPMPAVMAAVDKILSDLRASGTTRSRSNFARTLQLTSAT
jgi:hypothetical protein